MDIEETGSFSSKSDIANSPVDSLPGPRASYASQPDVVLSEERDSYYSDTLLGESFSELVETFLGSRRTTLLAPEMKALSSCLYYGLTNFIGKQTLGQEYCDIGLVPGSRGGRMISDVQLRNSGAISTSAARLYSIMRVGVPYVQERMKEGWHRFSAVRRPFRRNPSSSATGAESGLAAPAGVELGTSTIRTGSTSATLTPIASATTTVTTTATTRTQGSSGRTLSHSAMLHNLWRFLSWIRQKRPAIAKLVDWLLRLHLAAFYFDGRYANLAMRAVGARLEYTRGMDPPQARYAILGVLLLVQLMGEAATAVGGGGGTSLREGTGSDSGRSAEDADSHDAKGDNLAAKRVPAAPRERTTADAALYPRSRRRCSLCMSPRENAAATPCGHLFCWECIVGWCQTNPECPLCRQPVTPQSIICVYQYA